MSLKGSKPFKKHLRDYSSLTSKCSIEGVCSLDLIFLSQHVVAYTCMLIFVHPFRNYRSERPQPGR